MRLLLTADLQLGSGASLGTPERSRLDDNADSLTEISVLADDNNVDAIIVAGDVFQHRRPAIDELVVFRNWIDTTPVEVWLIAGNHDVRGADVPATIELFGREGLNVFTKPGLMLPGVLALPWTHPSYARRFLSSDEDVAESLVRVAGDLLPDGQPPVLVTHYALSGMSLPTGLSTDQLREPVLDTLALSEAGFDYIFAGHIHKPERTTWFTDQGDEISAVSIGSPWRHDFGEAAITPGVWILDTENAELWHEPLVDREFVTIDLETVEGDDDDSVALPVAPEGQLQVVGRPVDVRDAIVRVRVKVREQNVRRVSVENIRRNLVERGAHKVFIHLDVERGVRARSDVAEDSEPLVAVEAWASATGLDARSREWLRALTEKLLEATR